MSKTTIEVDTSSLDDNSRNNFHYHLDHFVRQLVGLGTPHTVNHSGASVVVDPSPIQTRGGEHPDSASPTGAHKKP